VRVESAPTALAEGGVLAATGPGVRATCGADDGPSLTDVAVEGGGTLSRGIDVDVVSGGCGAELRRVRVSGIAGPALAVSGDPHAEDRVQVHDGTFRESAIGVRVSGGKVTLAGLTPPEVDPDDAVAVEDNAGPGIVLDGDAERAMDVELLGARIAANGGTGVVLDEASTRSRLVMQGCVVFANGDVSPRTYGGGGSPRPVGGVLVKQEALETPFAFLANRVSANAGDQLAFESSGAWSISPGACAQANVFGCVGAGAFAIGVKGGGTVDASFTVWPKVPWTDLASAGVIAPPESYCNAEPGAPEPPPAASCPSP
jgi:hypothetical protein